jgi:hypothetical protein
MALLNFTLFMMKMGAADSSKSLIIIYQIIRRRIPEITAKKFQNFRARHGNGSGMSNYLLCDYEQCSKENTVS